MKTKRTRRPDARPAEILTAALKLARQHGYMLLTRETIADAAKCSPATVSHVFGTMQQLRRAIVGEAIRMNDAAVLAQAAAIGDKRAIRAGKEQSCQ